MNPRPIMDAGPGINFLAINQERLLFSALGPLSVPESVETEILRKSRRDRRFSAVERVWAKLPPRLLDVLSDDVTEPLAVVVTRISRLPMTERIQRGKDLGETMVIAHAVVAAELGSDVFILIDDQWGCETAAREERRLQRLRADGANVGQLRLIHTTTVLERAAGGEYIPDRNSMRALYTRMRELDDGLVPLEGTNLMDLSCWRETAS